MSPKRLLRDNFSPYEICLMQLFLGYGLGLAALIAMGTGQLGGGLILFVLTLVVVLVLHHIGRCPVCGKSPMHREPGELGWFALYVMNYRFRLWPERQCSGCRTALDMIQHDRP